MNSSIEYILTGKCLNNNLIDIALVTIEIFEEKKWLNDFLKREILNSSPID